MATGRSDGPAWIVRAVLVLALLGATSPAWRVLLLGAHPSVDELLQLRCFGGRIPHAASPAQGDTRR
jgi:hypothetical protein